MTFASSCPDEYRICRKSRNHLKYIPAQKNMLCFPPLYASDTIYRDGASLVALREGSSTVIPCWLSSSVQLCTWTEVAWQSNRCSCWTPLSLSCAGPFERDTKKKTITHTIHYTEYSVTHRYVYTIHLSLLKNFTQSIRFPFLLNVRIFFKLEI